MTDRRSTDEYVRGLETLLQQQLTRIRRRFFIHGTGTCLAVLVAALVVYFPLDRYLRLPGGVRVLLSLGLAVYAAWLVHRYLLYPLRRSLTRNDIALAIEERFPELRQKLISAVQLGRDVASAGPDGPRNQSPAMIELLMADAAAHAGRIPHRELLDPRRTAQTWGVAAALLLGALGFAAAKPGITGIFLQRIFGLSAAYPRDTYLVIEQPDESGEPSPEFRVQRQGDVIAVTLASGGDLPVLVRADGVIPREVDLVVAGGRGLPPRVSMSARSEQHFKYTFRRISGDFSFYPAGGDDLDGDGRVVVTVLRPPRVEHVRATITYPAYTRRPQPPVQTGSIETLVGSQVQFDVTTIDNAPVTAKLQLLESGLTVDLTPMEFEDDAGKRTGYRGTITVTRSDRYQVSLLGSDGLHNPRPDTYHIVATPDHPPVGKILAPLDDGLNMSLPDGLVPVWIFARDDYGLTDMTVSAQVSDQAEPVVRKLFTADPQAAPVQRRMVLTFLDLATAEFKQHAKVGSALLLTGIIADNREPEPMQKKVGPRTVRIIGETDLLRQISSHFRRVREDVAQNLKLLLDRNDRLEEIVEEVARGAALEKQMIGITTVEVAQGRIRAAASRIHVELMRAFNFHLFNRMESSAHAPAVLELYRTFHEQATEPKSFFPEFYRDLSRRRREGQLGAMEKTLDPILEMTASADRISEQLAPEALKDLAAARVATGNKAAAEALRRASERQRDMIGEFKSLRDRLDRWNEFQDVITNTRTLLDQQRDVKARTENLQKGKNK